MPNVPYQQVSFNAPNLAPYYQFAKSVSDTVGTSLTDAGKFFQDAYTEYKNNQFLQDMAAARDPNDPQSLNNFLRNAANDRRYIGMSSDVRQNALDTIAAHTQALDTENLQLQKRAFDEYQRAMDAAVASGDPRAIARANALAEEGATGLNTRSDAIGWGNVGEAQKLQSGLATDAMRRAQMQSSINRSNWDLYKSQRDDRATYDAARMKNYIDALYEKDPNANVENWENLYNLLRSEGGNIDSTVVRAALEYGAQKFGDKPEGLSGWEQTSMSQADTESLKNQVAAFMGFTPDSAVGETIRMRGSIYTNNSGPSGTPSVSSYNSTGGNSHVAESLTNSSEVRTDDNGVTQPSQEDRNQATADAISFMEAMSDVAENLGSSAPDASSAVTNAVNNTSIDPNSINTEVSTAERNQIPRTRRGSDDSPSNEAAPMNTTPRSVPRDNTDTSTGSTTGSTAPVLTPRDIQNRLLADATEASLLAEPAALQNALVQQQQQRNVAPVARNQAQILNPAFGFPAGSTDDITEAEIAALVDAAGSDALQSSVPAGYWDRIRSTLGNIGSALYNTLDTRTESPQVTQAREALARGDSFDERAQLARFQEIAAGARGSFQQLVDTADANAADGTPGVNNALIAAAANNVAAVESAAANRLTNAIGGKNPNLDMSIAYNMYNDPNSRENLVSAARALGLVSSDDQVYTIDNVDELIGQDVDALVDRYIRSRGLEVGVDDDISKSEIDAMKRVTRGNLNKFAGHPYASMLSLMCTVAATASNRWLFGFGDEIDFDASMARTVADRLADTKNPNSQPGRAAAAYSKTRQDFASVNTALNNYTQVVNSFRDAAARINSGNYTLQQRRAYERQAKNFINSQQNLINAFRNVL